MPSPDGLIAIRSCIPADLPGLAKLAARLVRERHAADPNRFMIFPHIEKGYAAFPRGGLRKRRSVVLVAEDGGNIIGYVFARIKSRDR